MPHCSLALPVISLILIRSIPHQSEAQLSKLVNKGACWKNPSPSLVASERLILQTTHMHRQADYYLNSSGAKCQMSSGPSGPIFRVRVCDEHFSHIF